MSVLYLHLDYESYKGLEGQMLAFQETQHRTTGGFYHKSIRLRVTPDLIIEFHGPLVGGYGHIEGRQGDTPGEEASTEARRPMGVPPRM